MRCVACDGTGEITVINQCIEPVADGTGARCPRGGTGIEPEK